MKKFIYKLIWYILLMNSTCGFIISPSGKSNPTNKLESSASTTSKPPSTTTTSSSLEHTTIKHSGKVKGNSLCRLFDSPPFHLQKLISAGSIPLHVTKAPAEVICEENIVKIADNVLNKKSNKIILSLLVANLIAFILIS